MGKTFTWDTLNETQTKHKAINDETNELCTNDELLLDRLYWLYKTGQTIIKSNKESETEWFKQIIRGAKYSRVGKKYILKSHEIECIKIDRICENSSPKAPVAVKKRRSTKSKLKTKRSKTMKNVVRSPSGSSRTESICSEDRNIEIFTNSSASIGINQCQSYQSDPISEVEFDPLKYDFSLTVPLASAVKAQI